MCTRLAHTIDTVVCVSVLSIAPLGSAALAQDGGLRGEYFNGVTYYYSTPAVTRTDPEINFDWGEAPPAPRVEADYFCVRWTGDLEVPHPGAYTFTLRTDGRVVLWVGDRAVIGQAWPQSDVYQGTMELVAGRVYPIELIYSAGKGAASIQLLWESPTLPQEVVPAVVLQLPLRARTPSPSDGATEIVQDVMLQWKAGCKVTHHDIYFGDDANDVESATPASAGIYRGRQSLDTTFFSHAPLEWNQTYYWRVDEVNDAEPTSPWKGNVWSFTTANFLLVDDFESYTDDEGERIYEIWIDGWFTGNGSTVGNYMTGQLSVAHGGRESMPFEYNNAAPPYYSEAYRTWDVPQDWTLNGVTDLSLWVKGKPLAFLAKPNGNIVLGTPGSQSDWGRPVVLRFGYRQLTGDGELVARVEGLTGGTSVAEYGIMVRETIESNSAYVAVGVTPNQSMSIARRLVTSGTVVKDDHGGVQMPHWVKLTREGNTFAAKHSTDGMIWADVLDAQGEAVVMNSAMSQTVCIGLYMTSHTWGGNATVEFSDIHFAGSISESWQVTTDHPGNSPVDLYVALEDSAGRIGVVVNPVPGAVNLTEWTQWRIPLSRFAVGWFPTMGVDLKAIRRMYIGVGDRDNPKPGGVGTIHIDDIRVIRSGPAQLAGPAVAVYPAHEAVDTPQSLELHWLAGTQARQHDVYFGEDSQAVADATPASVGIYQGRQMLQETRFNPGLLEWDKTYYWRIDEVNDSHPESPWKGSVWSFTTADFLVVDDFESYTEEEGWRLYEWWIDVWMHTDIWFTSTSIEHRIVHTGGQTMALAYDNVTLPFLSEADYWWIPAQDWTVKGLDTLVLFVRGHAGNDPAPAYVAIEDTSGKTAVVMHPDPHASLATEWNEWRVPLGSIPDVNLTKVKRMVIGVGDRVNPARGGRGTIYVDDIRVIRSSAGG